MASVVAGVTPIETSVAAVTGRDNVPATPADVAVMVAVPAPTPVTSPVALTVATLVFEDVQVTELKACLLPSL